MLRTILDRLQNDEAVRYGVTNSGPALGLLASQVGQLDLPMLALLGAAILSRVSTISPGGRWLRAVGGVPSLPAVEKQRELATRK